jgi:hypothetical protein
MDNFVTFANVDHYLDILNGRDVPNQKRSTIIKLLIEEENKLGRDLEQLQFAEQKAAACRNRAERQRRLRDALDPGSPDWAQADNQLANFESLARHVEGLCQKMRRQMNESGL